MISKAGVYALVCASLWNAGAAQTAGSHFERGVAHERAGRLADARAEYESALAIDGSRADARALHLDALCLLKLDRLEEGAQALERVVQAAPANGAAALTLATTWVSLGDFEKAQALLEGPLAKHPPEHGGLVRGMLLNAHGKYREAEKALTQALAANGKLPTVHSQLGYTLMLLGDHAGAVREFEAELALVPRDFNASANLGWIHVQEREFDRAAPFLAEALAQKPDNAGILYLTGQVWLTKGELGKAIGALERSVSRQPGFRAAYVLLARAYAKQGRAADVARVQAAIAKLNAEEQARNLGSASAYGGAAAQVPEFSGGRKK